MNNIPTGGGRDAQNVNDLGRASRTTRAAAPKQTPGEAPAGSPTSSVHVSAGGGHFMSLRARLEGLDASRSERVEQLLQLVAEGRYRFDNEAVAGAMLADPATARALGAP